jgi:hypothetical protein
VQYRCVTADVLSFDNDPTWTEANLRNTWELVRSSEDELLVFLTMSDGDHAIFRYEIADVDHWELTALALERGLRLVMPVEPELKIASDGFFSTTISIQSSIYSNSWLLRCVK